MRSRRWRVRMSCDDARHVRAVGIGEHGNAPAAVLALDLVGSVGLDDLRHGRQRDAAGGALDQHLAQRARAAVGIAQAQDDIEALRLVDDLRDDAAVGQRLERFRDALGVEPVACRLVVVDAHLQLRDAHLLFGLQVDDAGDRLEARFQVGGKAAQRVVVVAVDLERDLRAHTRQHVIEPVGDGLADGDARREHGQPLADVGEHLFAAALRCSQVDIELAVVDAFGMLVELGAPGAAADRVAPPAPRRRFPRRAVRCGRIRQG